MTEEQIPAHPKPPSWCWWCPEEQRVSHRLTLAISTQRMRWHRLEKEVILGLSFLGVNGAALTAFGDITRL